jgi:short subunit dehydrogenase-like uncharacterized protein
MATYDVVIYGATGFTGRQAARYLANRAPDARSLRWAIAGRNREKLERLHRSLPSDVGLIVADAKDTTAIEALVASTRVVLTTAGPYAAFGEPLMRACAMRGVDYVDITGETAHVRRMIDRYHDTARHSGARIVPFCGFDSIPSDLGVLLLVEHFRGRGVGTREVKGFFRAIGGLNGGTAASMIEMLRHPDDVRAMEDPLLLNPHELRRTEDALVNRDPRLPLLDPDLGRWVAPFFMAPINTRVVRRSRALASLAQADYGSAFSYQEYWDVGGPAAFVLASGAAVGISMYQMLSRLPGAANVMERFVPAPGEGPTDKAMDEGHFRALFVGFADDGTKAWALISDKGDPGNRVTVKCICESALALALDRDHLPGAPGRAGLLTPATALGLPLVARLRAAGMTLDCPARPDG